MCFFLNHVKKINKNWIFGWWDCGTIQQDWPNLEIQAAGVASLDYDRISISKIADEALQEESFWGNLDADLQYWTRPLRPIQV